MTAARARTVTSAYRFPPATPDVPPADECNREQLLELAAGAKHAEQLWALVGSQDHVAAICRLLVEHIEPELRASEAAVRELQEQLATAQASAASWQAKFERSDGALAHTAVELYEAKRAFNRERVAHTQTILQCSSELRESIEAASKR